jgi:hypothetical protein
MKLPPPFAPFVLCAAILSIAGGCEDSQARKRAEVQEIIQSATEQLTAAAAIRVDTDQQDKLRRDLTALISTLSGTTEGEPGQRAAASRLAGTAHRTLAAIDLDNAAQLEADNRSLRFDVGNMIDAALELNALATVLETVDTSKQREMLTGDQEAADEQLREHGEHMATLDGPIADIRRRNRDDRAKADGLREEAGELRREAADLGPGDGYTVFEESLLLDRQADQIEYEIARRELELRFILEPEHTLAQSRSDQAKARAETADRARQSLVEAAAALSGEAGTIRERIAEIRQQLATALDEIEQVSAGPLADLYERAASDLDRAATKAKSAATLDRGEGTDVARIEAARAYQQLGDMYWTRAHALQQDIALRQRLAANEDVLGSADADVMTALGAAHDEAVSEALDAYTDAKGLLDQVAGRAARRRLEALKMKVQALEAATSGQAVDVAALTKDLPQATAAAGDDASGSTSSGAESPDALLAALQSASDLASFLHIASDLTHIEFKTPAQRSFYQAFIASNRAMVELDQAVQEKFGTGLLDQIGGAGGQNLMGLDPSELGSIEYGLGEISGNHGTITVTKKDGATDEIKLIRVNGRWFLDGTDKFGEMTAPSGPAAEMVNTMIAGMQATTGVAQDFTRRVGAGEFNSTQEVLVAFGQAMAEVRLP